MNQQDWFKSIVLEVRPLLQSLNVFIILKQQVNKIDISIKRHCLQINFNNTLHEIPLENMEIVDDKPTNLQIADDSISFRIITNNKTRTGAFKAELLCRQFKKVLNLQNKHLDNEESYAIHCAICTTEFVALTKFDRVLPLPSENYEPNDLFCHKHASDDINLNPKLNEIFYSDCYMHVNSKLVKEVKETVNILRCNKCSCWIGANLKDVYKIWFNSVCIKSSANVVLKSDPLKDCFLTLNKLQDNNISSCNKIIFTCQIAENEIHFLLLWIMEKSLQIHLFLEKLKRQTEVAKVLFKFSTEETSEIKLWKDDVNVSNVSISKCMMDEIVQHLHEMNKLIPHNYSKTNNFSISYMLMYEE